MQYQVTEDEAQVSKNPHHIFNLNILLTHLFLSLSILKMSLSMWYFILIPGISIAVLSYVYFKGKQKVKTDSWFVAANWILVWNRGKILIYSYIAAIVIVGLYSLINMIIPSNFVMNDFSEDGTSTPIFQIITMILSSVMVLVAVIITFLQTGISVFDCSQGVIDKKIAKYLPRDENSNPEIGEYDEVQKAKMEASKQQAADNQS